MFVVSLSAVKRLMKEAQELNTPTELYHAQPLEVSFESIDSFLAMRSLKVNWRML